MRRLQCFAVAAGIAALTLASPVFAKSHAPDAWLTTKAKIAVLSAVGTAGTSIHVDTVDGKVMLHGKVRSDSEKKAAQDAARKIDGVTEVRNLQGSYRRLERSDAIERDERTARRADVE